jgi:hypothetical protein
LSGQKHVRGSIWIEQEIAIAAFLTATRKRDIPVILYKRMGIKREGVREQIKLVGYCLLLCRFFIGERISRRSEIRNAILD